LIFVESLFGADTVNTMPPSTLHSFLEHGNARSATILEKHGEELEALRALERHGVDLEAVCERLQVDGVAAFAKSFDELIAAIERKRAAR
jgi:transaldolase